MEATCNKCTHWEQDQNKVALQSNDFGVCDELSGQHGLEPSYVLPLVNEGKVDKNETKQFEMITGAMFGCNHFSQRRDWIR